MSSEAARNGKASHVLWVGVDLAQERVGKDLVYVVFHLDQSWRTYRRL